MAQCEATNVEGAPCGVPARTGSKWCIWHDPEKRDEADKLRLQGGEARTAKHGLKVRTVSEEDAPPPPKTIEDANHWLSWLAWAVTTGKIDARTAHDATYALRAFLDGQKIHTQADGRLKELEAKYKALREQLKGSR